MAGKEERHDFNYPRRQSHRIPASNTKQTELLQAIAELRAQRMAKPHDASNSSAVASMPSSPIVDLLSSSAAKSPSFVTDSSDSFDRNSSGRQWLLETNIQKAKVSSESQSSRSIVGYLQNVENEADSLLDRMNSLSIVKERNVVNCKDDGYLREYSRSKASIIDKYSAFGKQEIPFSPPEAVENRSKASLDSACDSSSSTTSSYESATEDLSSENDDMNTLSFQDNSKSFQKMKVSQGFKISRKKEITTKKPSMKASPPLVLVKEVGIDRESQLMVFCDSGKRVFKLNKNVEIFLYDHQREGIKWLWGLHLKGAGGILGDDMGLGKTMQISAFLSGLFSSRLIKCALVVAPKTLVAQWRKELASVGLSRKIKDYSGTPTKAREYALQHVLQVGGVLLTTYDIVRSNWKALRGDLHGRDGYGDTSDDIVTWDYVILDEGHLVKNPSTQRAKTLREIPTAHRIVITGTPIQNNLKELWALFDFACPQLLGDHKEFKAKYADVILRANDKDATDRQKRMGSAVAQDLRKKIAPFFLRRMKSDVFSTSHDSTERKLSQKNDIIIWLRLTGHQRNLYKAFLESERAHLAVEGSALAALTVLKKICDHPALLTKRAADDIAEGMESILGNDSRKEAEMMTAELAQYIDADEDYRVECGVVSCKIVFLMSLLETLIQDGHRTLIFAQTRKMLDLIQKEIILKQYTFRRIDGTLKSSDRERSVQEFQSDSSIMVFLLTSQVGGLGLTLTAADRVVIVDPAWNPSTDNQSVDRAYRIGQVQDVLVYRLMTSGTIEEKIYRKQVFKGGLFKVATEQKEQFRYFSQQDLQDLLSLPKMGFDISLTQQQLQKEHGNQFQSEELKKHIELLEKLGIVGVSHHDLLFSKQAPELPPDPENDANTSKKTDYRKVVYVKPKSSSSKENASVWIEEENKALSKAIQIDPVQKEYSRVLGIKENIQKLSKLLTNKALVANLPDKGENIRRKIRDLTNEMNDSPSVIGGTENDTAKTSGSRRRSPLTTGGNFEKDEKGKQIEGKNEISPDITLDGEHSDTKLIVDVDDVSSIFKRLNIAKDK